MKFKNIIIDLITEDFQNKKLFNLMLNKWFGPNPSDREKNETDVLLTNFFEIKNRLVLTLPEIITFLVRYENFPPNGLKDIRNYSIDQAKFIISEFVDINYGQEDTTPEIFTGRDLPPTEERIEASKNLWYSNNENLIVNEGDFRIYEIKNRKDAINFGYYNGKIRTNQQYNMPNRNNMQWCVTRFVQDSNLYAYYRTNKGRTFYFVIDESKHPDKVNNGMISQYYISVLQYATDSPTNFRLTSIMNDGSDPSMDPNELYTIYPKLRGHLDKIVKKEYSQQELGETISVLDRVDENPGNPNEFAKMSKTVKKRYIDSGKVISKKRSWETMNLPLKQSYIDITERGTVFERFSSKELLEKIKSKQSELTSLNKRLEFIGYEKGIKFIIEKMTFDEHIIDQRLSILNQNISLFQHKSTKKYGLWNKTESDWVTLNGVVYDSNYVHDDEVIFSDENGGLYISEIYSKNGRIDDTTFYCIFPMETNKLDGYFLSHQKWLKLQEKIDLVGDGNDIEFSPDDDTDLKEYEEF